MNFMLDRPAQWLRCASDRRYCDKVVDEVLRAFGRRDQLPQRTRDVIPWRNPTGGDDADYFHGCRLPHSGPVEKGLAFRSRAAQRQQPSHSLQPGHAYLSRHVLAKLQIGEGLTPHRAAAQEPAPRGEIGLAAFPVVGPKHLADRLRPGAAELSLSPRRKRSKSSTSRNPCIRDPDPGVWHEDPRNLLKPPTRYSSSRIFPWSRLLA